MESKKKQTVLVYCVFVASGDTIFSHGCDGVHDYRGNGVINYIIENRLPEIIYEIESVMYEPEYEKHVFYLPYAERIRKALSNHNIQFYSVIPEANCMHEWIGRMHIGRYPSDTIDTIVHEWKDQVRNVSEYPGEMIIRLSHGDRLSSIPVRNLFDEKAKEEAAKKHRKIKRFFGYIVLPFLVFTLYVFWLLSSNDIIPGIDTCGIIGISIVTAIFMTALTRFLTWLMT